MLDLMPFFISGIATGAIYVLSGVGIVVLYRASGVLNLAQGAVGALGALIAWSLLDASGNVPLAWGTGIATSIAVSVLYGRFIAPKLSHADAVVRAVATLSFGFILLGLMDFVWGERGRRLALPIDGLGLDLFDVRITYARIASFAIATAITIAVMLLLSKTRLGLSMRALADDRRLSGMLGIRVLTVDVWAWAISGALAGISGLLIANIDRLDPQTLTFLVIPTLAAGMVGRLRSLPLTVCGGALIGILEGLATPFAEISAFRTTIPFIVAAVALLWYQRHGIALSRIEREGSTPFAPHVPRTRRRVASIATAACAAFALVFIFLPVVAPSYWLVTATSAAILSIASLSVAMLYSQLGLVSLCQYSLLAVGGWVTLRIGIGTGVPFEISLLCGGVAAALCGAIAGLPGLRMRGLYFAIVTLMIAGAVQIVIGTIGFPGEGLVLARPAIATSDADFFRYCLVATVLCFGLVWLHRRAKPGRAWATIRTSESCAVAIGVNLTAYKLWAFALGGFLAGIAGALLAANVGELDGRTFPAGQSISLFALSVVGGAFNWFGPLIAGLLLRAVPSFLSDRGVDGNLATAIFGVALLQTLITAPQGIAGQVSDALLALERRFEPARVRTERAPKGTSA
jgi:branched-chain amino acid transport system permease protein